MKFVAVLTIMLAFTFTMWGLFIWMFGELGIMLIVISGYTMPIWGLLLSQKLCELIGLDD